MKIEIELTEQEAEKLVAFHDHMKTVKAHEKDTLADTAKNVFANGIKTAYMHMKQSEYQKDLLRKMRAAQQARAEN